MRSRRENGGGSSMGLRVRTKSYVDKRRRRCKYLVPAMAVIVTGITTLIYFVAIRLHNVELSFEQQVSFERQTTELANRTFYVTSTSDDLVHTLPTSDWAKVSARIDVIAYTAQANSAVWATKVSQALASFNPPGLGVVLHPCGCVVPNALLIRSSLRFGIDTCGMLTGFVFPARHVAWVNDYPSSSTDCELKAPTQNWFAFHEHKLERARSDFADLKELMISKHAEELTKLNKAKS